MNKKYELTPETITWNGRTLYRIKALRDFADVEAGDLGGFIEKESNLSHNGDAWVCGNARVYDNASVCGNACVYDNARVCGNTYVCGNACVYGNTYVCGNARVCGNACVYGNACVSDNAYVYGNACVYGNTYVCGNARVCGNTYVCGNARVCKNAHVYGDARVCKNATISHKYDYITVDNIGSRNGTTTFYRCEKNVIKVTCGCFNGTIDEFETAVKEKHAGTVHEKEYLAAIALAKVRAERWATDDN